jgi:hypothetical protein
VAVYKNAEIRKAGDVIRANVEVDSFVPISGPSAGTVEWSGILRPPNNTGLIMDETYTLVLPGFSPAKITITGEANPVDGSVTFKGIDELRVSAPSRQVQESK